ncbi:MAG: DNA replication/repair protein RecF [Ectothiorhodospiraceae bacterium]|nr:DNA replication/repair protein RecF [Ectothiorhodospiraceae bacterium]
MAIQHLEIHNLRNLSSVSLKPQPGLNFIFGPNGSGKTSILEAIHCLGRGKSFRTHKTNHLIQEGCDSFSVIGKVLQHGRNTTIGMERKTGNSNIRLAGQAIARSSELSEVLPVAVLDPGLHRLIEEGPDLRRRFLDWGVFHVKHGFSSVWNAYRRILSQRNAALRLGWTKSAIAHWDQELVVTGKQLDEARQSYLSELLVFVDRSLERYPSIANVKITYQQGWRAGTDFSTYLSDQFDSDRERGFTQFGPHRADIKIRVGGSDARDFLSRGRQKLLVANLILSQCRQITAQDTCPVILVDDLPAELDTNTRALLIQTLQETQAQIFITATDPGLFDLHGLDIQGLEYGMFHVEHGEVSA